MCSSCQSGRSQAVIDYLLYQKHEYCGARCGCKACLCRSQPARFESQLHTSCTLFFIITYFINSIPYIGLARGCSAVVTLAPWSLELLGSKPVCGWRCLFFAKFIFNSYVQDNAKCKTRKWKCRSAKGGSVGPVGRRFDSTSHFFCVKKC